MARSERYVSDRNEGDARGRLHYLQGSRADAGSAHMPAFSQLDQQIISRGSVSAGQIRDFLDLENNPSFRWREGLTIAAWGRRPLESKGWMP
jgi:hypothetical protein